MKHLFFPLICMFVICSCRPGGSRLPDGWYHIDNTRADSIVTPAILTVDQIAAVNIDSTLQYEGGMMYQISGRVVQAKKKDFADATEQAIGRQIAFVHKGKIVSAPMVNARIDGGRFSIAIPECKNAFELYNSIATRITPEPDYPEPAAARDTSKLYVEDFIRFDSLLNAWTKAYRSNPAMQLSSNTGDARKLEQYPHMLRMGKKVLPMLMPYLAHPGNFFMLPLYDDLQDNAHLKSSDHSKGEQYRAQESVRKYVEDRLQIKKRTFASDKEKLAAMKELMFPDGEPSEHPHYSKQQMDSIMLISDYDIMKAVMNNQWFDEIAE